MANFSLVIVPAKVLTGGKHKVRVMVSHNGQTRYIPTDIIIDSISEFKEGRVVKRPDKDILNLRLKKICDKYFERYMELEFLQLPDMFPACQAHYRQWQGQMPYI